MVGDNTVYEPSFDNKSVIKDVEKLSIDMKANLQASKALGHQNVGSLKVSAERVKYFDEPFSCQYSKMDSSKHSTKREISHKRALMMQVRRQRPETSYVKIVR